MLHLYIQIPSILIKRLQFKPNSNWHCDSEQNINSNLFSFCFLAPEVHIFLKTFVVTGRRSETIDDEMCLLLSETNAKLGAARPLLGTACTHGKSKQTIFYLTDFHHTSQFSLLFFSWNQLDHFCHQIVVHFTQLFI